MDFSYYGLVKSPTVPLNGRTFGSPFFGADRLRQQCYSEHVRCPQRRRPDPQYEGTDRLSDGGTGWGSDMNVSHVQVCCVIVFSLNWQTDTINLKTKSN